MKIKSILILLGAFLSVTTIDANAKANVDTNKISSIEYYKSENTNTGSTTTKKNDKKSKSDKSPQSSPKKYQLACTVEYEPFIDLRSNQQTLGFNGSHSIEATDLDKFLMAAEDDLWKSKIIAVSGPMIRVVPKLVSLYSFPESTNIHGTMAFEVDFVVNGKVIDSKKYRGLGSTMNGMNAEHEYFQALSYAANTAMTKMIIDLSSQCNHLN